VRLDPASGYGLTDEGKNLVDALAPLSNWAQRWQRRAVGK
jgi:DNA-binding HxlR family transcriptional regulator